MVQVDSHGRRITVLSSCRYWSNMERMMSVQTVLAGGLDAVLEGIVILYLTRAWCNLGNGGDGGLGGLDRCGGAIAGVDARGWVTPWVLVGEDFFW